MYDELNGEQSLRHGENEANSVATRSDAGRASVGCSIVTYDKSWSRPFRFR